MEKREVFLIARHQFRLLFRNRLFLLYFLFAYALTLYLQVRGQTRLLLFFVNTLQQSAGAIPYLNAYLFTVLQLLPAVVLGNDAFCRSRRLDSLDAIYYRPAGNGSHVAGVTLGFLGAWGVVYALFWVSALVLQVLFTDTSLHLGLYLLYPLTIVVPGVVFTLGFTFLVSRFSRGRLLGLLLTMAPLALLLGYGGEVLHGVLDPLGLSLAAGYSGFTGLSNPLDFLLQRSGWLLLGLGCLAGSVLFFPRLPNRPGSWSWPSLTVACVLLGLLSCGVYADRYLGRLSSREAYREVYKRYAGEPKATTLAHDIDYRQEGGVMEVVSGLTVTNDGEEPIPSLLLYLNPGLEVRGIKEGDRPLAFRRDGQVIVVDRSLAPGDTLRLRVDYGGTIDESVCHVNVPDEKWNEPTLTSEMSLRHGKRYAYLEGDYTLLTPGVLWYPTTLPAENPVSVYDLPVDFVRYTLRVRNPRELTVISQGRRSGTLEDIRFRDEHPLPGITLCMGRYTTRRVEVDGITYELNLLEGHERLLLVYDDPRASRLDELIRNTRRKAEKEVGRSYPFSRLMFVETPLHFASYFQGERRASQYVQPEMMLCREWGCGWLYPLEGMENPAFCYQRFFIEDDVNRPFLWKEFLQEGFKNSYFSMKQISDEKKGVNPMMATALFFEHVNVLYSSRYPYVNALMQIIARDNSVTSRWGRLGNKLEKVSEIDLFVNHYLSNRSFKDAFKDSTLSDRLLAPILLLESRELLNRLMVRGVEVNHMVKFINTYLEKNPFRVLDFEDFGEDFIDHFGIDLGEILREQEERSGLPTYIVQLLGEEIYSGDKSIRYTHFRVYNDSDVDGFIHVEKAIPAENDDAVDFWEKRLNDYRYEAYELKAHSGIEFRKRKYKSDLLCTNLSRNLPSTFKNSFDGYTDDTSVYVRPVSRDVFLPSREEIVVDNEDEGFIVHEPRRSLLERLMQRERKGWERYCFMFTSLYSAYWSFFIGESAYGNPVRSYVGKMAGNGSSFLEWRTELPRGGKYEVWVYLPFISRYERGMVQIYEVRQGKWQETIELTDMSLQGWNLLGVFDCQVGECIVSLSDRGEKEQMICGDAVKWVFVQE